jgi:hypothetical protein
MKICYDNEVAFDEWCFRKNNLNYRVNRAVFFYLKQKNIKKNYYIDNRMSNQFILDFIVELLFEHFKKRIRLYQLSNNHIDHERLFILISFLTIYFYGFMLLLKGIWNFGIGYKFEFMAKVKSVSFAINFPEHSFSIQNDVRISELDSQNQYSSFGEFLVGSGLISNESSIISIDEYIRKSKMNELGKDKLSSYPNRESVNKVQNIKLLKSRSIILISLDLWKHFSQFLFLGFKMMQNFDGIVAVKRFQNYITAKRYKDLFDELKIKRIKLKSIFLIPFENSIGDLKYDSEYNKKCLVFNYGENLLIPPSTIVQKLKREDHALLNLKELMSEFSISAFNYCVNGVGFTDILFLLNSVRSKIEENYSIPLPMLKGNKAKQKTAVLGYEIDEINLDDNKFLTNIAIFDIPPEGKIEQLRRALSGDRSSEFNFIKEFLMDIVEFAMNKKVRLIHKPKYSLENYSKEYQMLIRSFKDSLTNRFVVLNPYTRLGTIFSNIEASLSMPYTSPKIIGDELLKKSFYYVPEKYRSTFSNGFAYSNSIIGKEELKDKFDI